jgi:Recombination endonuclease VII
VRKPLTEEQKERQRRYMRAWRAANPGYLRDWRARNPLSEERRSKELDRGRERYYKRSEEQKRRYRAKVRENTYGITEGQFDDMLQAQGGACAICGKTPESKGHHVDHCHRTGAIRGVLCDLCNRGLGFFKDSSEALRMAAQYIDSHDTGLKVSDLHKANQAAWRRAPKKRTR